MSQLTHTTALELIANWSTEQVVEVLKKNGQEECAYAVHKRQIDGDELLNLTEAKLRLWKSDLSRDQIWSLWNFVEEIRRSPVDYVSPQVHYQTQERISSSGSEFDTDWGIEFDTDEDDSPNSLSNVVENGINFGQRLSMFEKQGQIVEERKNSLKISQLPKTDGSTHMNDESMELHTYLNLQIARSPSKSVLRLQKNFENVTFAEKLKGELELFKKNNHSINQKPELPPKPNSKAVISSKPSPLRKQTPKSATDLQKKTNHERIREKPGAPAELPRPPLMLRSFDLVANLPVLGSNESVYKPSSSTTSHDEEDDSKLYESISDTEEDDGYVEPKAPTQMISLSPLPSKPNVATDIPVHAPLMTQLNEYQRSPEKKQPLAGRTSTFSEMRATRPLPPPPDKLSHSAVDPDGPKIEGPFCPRTRPTRRAGNSESCVPYTEAPWFHNVSREQATRMIKERPHNGYFLMRPCISNPINPLVLVVWFKDRVYNVPVRRRPDRKYALGTPKDQEQTFTAIEEIVPFYSREDVKLQGNDEGTGLVKLTDSPPK